MSDRILLELTSPAWPDPFGTGFSFGPAQEKSPAMSDLTSGFKNAAGHAAHCVEQAQVGFSADAPMATENVADCIGLILRDPVSGKTALAHIDRYTTPKSLEKIFESMPRDRTLDAALWGAKYAGSADADSAERAWSEHNLEKAAGLLAGRNVRIAAAGIGAPDIPSVVAIDPVSGAIRGENPERRNGARTIAIRPNPDRALSYAKMVLQYAMPRDNYLDSIDLETAFDLTRQPGRYPILFRRQELALLDDAAEGKTPQEVRAWAERHYPPGMTSCVAAQLPIWNDAKNKALAELRSRGTDTAARAMLYVGEGADMANLRLAGQLQDASRAAAKSSALKPS
jgi:hypothetical protein